MTTLTTEYAHELNIPEMKSQRYLDLLEKCVHCGLCLEVCPTYNLFGTEMDSPRGRISLMKAASEGRIDQKAFRDVFAEHITLCLECRACETACPSGVEYGKLIEGAQISLAMVRQAGIFERFAMWIGMKQLMPHVKRFRFLAGFMRLYQRIGLQSLVRRINLLPKTFHAMEFILPPIASARPDYGKPAPALGKKHGKVAFFYGCVQEAFLSQINAATIRVLQRNGYEVHYPQNQTCCGAAQWHTGDEIHARVLARQNIDAFLSEEYDAIINNAGGCGLTLLEYPDLLRDDPEYYERAKLFASKVQDFSKFLWEHLNEKPATPIRLRAVYSDSCHLRHGQKVIEPPRQLLESIPGLELVEMNNPDKCCGSAGIYNIMNPEPANAILDAKMLDIASTEANLIVTSNAGCHMQLTAGVRRANIKARVMHIAEVLDHAYCMEAGELLKTIRHPKPIFGYPKRPQRWLAWLDKRRKNGKENGNYSSLKTRLQSGQVISDPVEMITYEMDAGIEKGHPSGVAFPYSTQDVQIIMRWISEKKIALTARGAGTGLAGNAVAEHGGLILAFSQMKQVLEFDREGHTAVIQPGVITQELDELVQKDGLYYPPDPASGRSSTIGANISLNSGGPHCFKYGMTSNYILGLDVVLADGRSLKLGGRALDYPEYDLTGLMTGSEGTLGIITEAVVRLRRNPPAAKTMMAAFKTLEDAGNAVSAIIARGLVPATLELMDRRMVDIIRDYMPPGMPVDVGAILIIETDGYPESVSLQMDEIVSVLDGMNVVERKIAQDEAQREKIWYARKSVAGSMANLAAGHYTVDVSVPRSRMAEALNQVVAICDEYDLPVGIIGHAGDGNLHPMIMIQDPEDRSFMERVFQAAEKICEICTGMQGSITGEHGIGNEKNQFMPLMYNHDELAVMHEIRDIFDPQGLLNPGKIFPAEMPPAEILPKITSIPDSPFAPRTTDEAAMAIRAWVSQGHQIQVSSSQVNSVDPGGKKILATENLNQVIDYQPDDLYITAGAGMKLTDLQLRLAGDRLYAPLLSPWEQATLGEIVAANFNAPLRMHYGGLRDLVLALKVVLPDGRIIRPGRPVVKNVAGYDLVKLFIGSYGTLGLITEITLKLIPTPQQRSTLIIPVDDLENGMGWGRQLFHQALISTAILLCPGDITTEVDSPYMLVHTMEGLAENVITEKEKALTRLIDSGAPQPREINLSGSELWGSWLSDVKPNDLAIRVGIPSKDLTNVLKTDLLRTVRSCEFIADIANGLLYLKGKPDLDTIRKAAFKHSGYAVVLNGDDAIPRKQRWMHRPDSLELMHAIKSRWDEKGLLNPDAFIEGSTLGY